MIGTTISHYTLLEKLGQGGVGTVYKALDQKLHRFVAIKFLNPEYSGDPHVIERFKQEAIAASSLNHPNICTIHEIGSQKGLYFIVMEFIDGKSLSDLLSGRALDAKEFIVWAIKICHALEAAHARGLIHRDIKPDNIMITAGGAVKLMDFGLAKLKSDLAEDRGGTPAKQYLASHSQKTTTGSFWGSVAYISPEQINKKPVDERSDIFSLGVMFYEMYTGKMPFTGENNFSVLKNILEKEPTAPSATKGKKNSRIDAILLKALAKDPDRRYAAMHDMVEELEALQRRVLWKKTVIPWLCFIVFIVSAILLISSLKPVEKEQPLYLKMKPLHLSTQLIEEWPCFSPDGRQILFTSRDAHSSRLVIKDLTTGRTRTVLQNSQVFSPHWSPKNDRIVYSSLQSQIIIDTLGRTVQEIKKQGIMPRCSPDGGTIAFCQTTEVNIAARNTVYLYSIHDSTTEKILSTANRSYAMPDWSPDSRWIVCIGGIGSIWELWIYNPKTARARELSHFNTWVTNPRWSRDGEYIYYISNAGGLRDLWRVRIDLTEGRLTYPPVQLTNGLHIGSMDISPDGESLIFSQAELKSELCRLPVYIPLTGEPLLQTQLLMQGLDETENIEISPDGSQLVLETKNLGIISLIIKSLATGEETLLYNAQPAYAPCWSADGKRIAFDAGGGDNADIYEISAAGGIPVKIIDHSSADWFPSLSPDGHSICWISNRNGQLDLWLQELKSGTPVQLTDTRERESRAAWSHDSSHLAFFRFAEEQDSTEICLIDLSSRQLTKLAKIYDAEKNITTKLSWDQADVKLYFFQQGAAGIKSAFAEISLRDRTIRPIFLTDRLRFWTSAFSIFKDHGYFIVYQEDHNLWILEGLK